MGKRRHVFGATTIPLLLVVAALLDQSAGQVPLPLPVTIIKPDCGYVAERARARERGLAD